MWQFHHPLRPHLQNFSINFTVKNIPCNKSVAIFLSPVIKNYIERYPSANDYSISKNDIGNSGEIDFSNLNVKILSCLFLGLNFYVQEKDRLPLQVLSNYLQIEPLTNFLIEIDSQARELQNVFSSSSEMNELFFLEESVFSLNNENFNSILNFLNDNNAKYGSSTIHSLLFSFFFARPSKRELFYKLVEKLENVSLKKFLRMKVLGSTKVNYEIITLNEHYRLKKSGIEITENENQKNSAKFIKLMEKDDVDNFADLTHVPQFNINEKISRMNVCSLLPNKCTLIELSAFYGAEKIFKFLLLNNANLNSDFIVKCAIAGGNSNIIHTLENSIKSISFDNTLNIAVMYHHQEIFEWLVESCNQKLSPDELLDLIFSFSNFKALNYIIDKIGDFRHFAYLAFFSGNMLFAKISLKFDSLTNVILEPIKNFFFKNNLLIQSATNQKNDIFDLLISMCEDKEKELIYKAKTKDGQNLMHICCENNNRKLLQNLIEKARGFSIKPRDEIENSEPNNKNSEVSNENKNSEVLDENKSLNAIKSKEFNEEFSFAHLINQLDNNLNTPLKLACLSLNEKVISILLNLSEVDPNLSNPLKEVLIQNSEESTKLFFSNPRYDITQTPYILNDVLSSWGSSPKIIELVMKNPRITTSIVMKSIDNLIEYVGLNSCFDLLEVLFRNIDLAYQDEKGNTLLHNVCQSCSNSNIFKVIELIVVINPKCLNITNYDSPFGRKPFSLLYENFYGNKLTQDNFDEVIKSRDFMINHPSALLDENDMDYLVKVSKIAPITSNSNGEELGEEEEEEDIDDYHRTHPYFDDEAEEVESYSDDPILKDEDIVGTYLVPPSNINEDLGAGLDYEEEDEEEEYGNDNDNDNDSSDSDGNNKFDSQKIRNIVIVSDHSSEENYDLEDEQISLSDDEVVETMQNNPTVFMVDDNGELESSNASDADESEKNNHIISLDDYDENDIQSDDGPNGHSDYYSSDIFE